MKLNNLGKKQIVFLESLPVNWFDKYARNPGYNGSTHTAPIGANSPAKKDNQKLSKTLILTSCYWF